MALAQRLDLRQTQALVMTPQLQQAIKLLQLSNLELAAYVDQELERNPLLERDDDRSTVGITDEAQATGFERIEAPAERVPEDRRGADELTRGDAMPDRDAAPLDADYSNEFSSAPVSDSGFEAEPPRETAVEGPEPTGDGDGGLAGWTGGGGSTGFDDIDGGLEERFADEIGLRDRLLQQVATEFADPTDRAIAAFMVDQIDEAGYLAEETGDLAEQLGCPVERLERVIARLQRLDPVGCFARSLAECLGIQLAEQDRFDPAMQALIANLGKLAERDYPGLRRLCGVDGEDLADMIAEIRALDPKPGTRYRATVAQTVTPDILMRALPTGGWAVTLNSATLPRVLANRRYYTEVIGGARNKEEREYLSDCWASATWLTKSLHQRAQTILKVAGEIVRQQDAFFLKGVQHLKPLILRDIAEKIDMHESTVSRVTTNKYLATPRGVYELKYFFTAAIQGAGGAAAHSAESVRHRIKTLIDAESPGAVLSDDRIVEILRGDGVDIARRTVAKYREALRIPSSVQRRREKALMTGS